MRVVILCSSPYSETGCAAAARLAQSGMVVAGALTLPAWDRATLVRKLGQWGWRDSLRYAKSKLAPRKRAVRSEVRDEVRDDVRSEVRNPYLEPVLRHGQSGRIFRNLHEVASHYHFPVVTVSEQNSPKAIARLKQWSSDVAIFTGGNILRDRLLKVPRLGVINSHLAMLPEIRGMSSPEWSLLCEIPLGITIHFMDAGIDTGPILLRREFTAPEACRDLADLRNRMIAQGIELVAESVAGLAEGAINAQPQPDREKDNQFFVMHERLKNIAARRLHERRSREDRPAAAASVVEKSDRQDG